MRVKIRLTAYKVRGLMYRGKKYYCNCCEKGFRRFITFGYNKRANACCPHCNSLERHRMLKLYIERELSLSNKSVVLHVAPAPCMIWLKKLDILRYESIDLEGVLGNSGDLAHLPYLDSSFDLVICSHVLAYVNSQNRAIRELHRVLRPNGVCLILNLMISRAGTVVRDEAKPEEIKLMQFGGMQMQRIHGLDVIEDIRKGGFEVTSIDYRMTLSNEEHRTMSLGIGEHEQILRCNKQPTHNSIQ